MPLRQPVVAGRFYTAQPDALRAEVQAYLEAGQRLPPPLQGKTPLGCMAPHAGYMFSGPVAGLTLGQIPVPRTVMLLGPSHTGRGAPLALWPEGAWRSPLGDTPIDQEAVEYLTAYAASPFQADTLAHGGEHALEVLLPFLQLAQPELKIIPLCVREYRLETLKLAALGLAALARERAARGEKILLLASSDMSHYLPQDEGRRKDILALDQILKLSPEGLFQVCTSKKISMCGFAPMTLTLFACKELGATEAVITAHTNSGVTGKKYGAATDSVVGYAGAIVA